MNRVHQGIIIVLMAAVAGCGGRDKNEADSVRYERNVSHVIDVAASTGSRVPDFSWIDDTGSKVSLSAVTAGKPVLINFWATWCGPCVKEMPDLVALNDEYASRGAVVIGISIDRDADVLRMVSRFTQEKNVRYQVVIDDGRLEQAFGGIRGIPTSLYINKKGTIVRKLVGMQSKEEFAQELRSLL